MGTAGVRHGYGMGTAGVRYGYGMDYGYCTDTVWVRYGYGMDTAVTVRLRYECGMMPVRRCTAVGRVWLRAGSVPSVSSPAEAVGRVTRVTRQSGR